MMGVEDLINISKNAYISEADALKKLAPYLDFFKNNDQKIRSHAKELLIKISGKKPSLTQSLMKAFPIKTPQGNSIMSLAECLGRVPDNKTAYALINDKISNIKWDKHKGSGFFIKLVEFALSIAAKTGANAIVHKALKSAFTNLGDEFVIGEDFAHAAKPVAKLKKAGYLISYDMLGEGARTKAQSEKYLQSYLQAVEKAASDDSVSVKISALYPRYELLKYEQLEAELLPNLRQIIAAAKQRNLMIVIDAEEARRLDLMLLVFTKLHAEFNYNNFGLAVQAYNKRALDVLKYLAGLKGAKIPVRLVKGAYWDAEIKKAQELGLPDFPVYTAKQNTDLSYLACAKFLLDNNQKFYPQFATHNLLTICAIEEIAQGKEYEFQRLYGMGKEIYDVVLAERKLKCRVYAPVGGHEELLAYLIRRLLENGANTGFINQLAAKDLESVLRSPFAESAPTKLKLPSEIFGARKNSNGWDLGCIAHIEEIKQGLAAADFNPQEFTSATQEECEQAILKAQKAFANWSNKTVVERAKILEKAADLLEENKFELLKAVMEEGKKNLPDAIAELREATDFCRYYAKQACGIMQPKKLASVTGEENILHLHGRGVFVCISPWNFPLAIFMGQVVAALVTGNSVIAKAAEQTTNIAHLAVNILYKAGVPQDVLQLIHGKGSVVGGYILANPNINGVCFTGGTDTAKIIQKTILSNPAIIPFIAETGGQNAMIVDSTALPEQAVDDIINSAFGTNGQRCSALRVLYVQNDIADELINLLHGAMAELEKGTALSTDLRGIIDEAAEEKILQHTKKYGQENLPAIIEIKSILELTQEVFGPVLHIVRFADINKAVEEINSTGYGLTFGIHTRIMSRAYDIAARIKAGNIYINRGMTGAVVESQPFGGMGLSGTGFKAGGQNYLLRFCDEKTVTCNLTAIGGNLDIL